MADAWGSSWGTAWASHWLAGTAAEGGYRKRKRRVYTEVRKTERPERPERKPRIRAVPVPLADNTDEVIARATTELDSIAPPVLAAYDGIGQRRRDDEALLLIMLLAE